MWKLVDVSRILVMTAKPPTEKLTSRAAGGLLGALKHQGFFLFI